MIKYYYSIIGIIFFLKSELQWYHLFVRIESTISCHHIDIYLFGHPLWLFDDGFVLYVSPKILAAQSAYSKSFTWLPTYISGGWENWHIMQMKAKWLNTFLIYTSSFSSPPTLAHVLVMDWVPESWVSGFGNSCHSLLDNAPLRVRYPKENDFVDLELW